MLIRGIRAAALGAALALAAPALATADITIGSAAIPAAPETHERCEAPALGGDPGLVLYQLASDPSTSYAAPAGGWLLTHCPTNVDPGDPAAAPEPEGR